MPRTPPSDIAPLVLAGGRGTRLRSAVGDLPKPLAAVRGRPFVTFLLERIARAGFSRAAISIGHGADRMRHALGDRCCGLALDYVEESEPLGTGGAARLAATSLPGERWLVMNGDSLVDVPLAVFAAWALEPPGPPALVAARVPDLTRYGALRLDGDAVAAFTEKGRTGAGWINAGICLLDRADLERLPDGAPCSLETDLLEPLTGRLRAFRTPAPFIDIGLPESLAEAQGLAWLDGPSGQPRDPNDPRTP